MDNSLFLGGRHGARLADFVVTGATDGNHGRALAAAAPAIYASLTGLSAAQVRDAQSGWELTCGRT